MITVIGVRFRTAGKIYYFDPLQFEIKRGDHVIVETARGIEFGTVVMPPKEVPDEKVIQPLKSVLRLATEKDIEQEAENKIKEKEAYRVCLEKIRKHELEMKLIDAEYTFDNNKVLFYFTADGRIDFRELVKDLAAVFKTRIELRQIGVRDETKIVGGIGICGRPLCCHTHLSEFAPVSIKMAKEQNLSLNPTKISGVCGRLMCCLNNEEETYEELNRRLPNPGDFVTTEDGQHGEVHSVNVLRQLVKVLIESEDEKELKEYPVEQLQFKKRHKAKKDAATAEEMRQLKELEKLDQIDKSEGEGHDKGGRPERTNKGQRKERTENGERGEGKENSSKNDRKEKRENHSLQSKHTENGGEIEDADNRAQNKQGGNGGRFQNRRGSGNSAQNKQGNNEGQPQKINGNDDEPAQNKSGNSEAASQNNQGNADGQSQGKQGGGRFHKRNRRDRHGKGGQKNQPQENA